METSDQVRAALAEFDRSFAAGDADALAELFATDAQLLLLHREAIDGRPAIRDHWTRFFAQWDTAAWQTEVLHLQQHGDRAATLSTYSETLLHRGGEPSRQVHGRLVLFLRLEPGGPWRVAVAMNSHVRPVEPAP
jgi:uncharacterized protein (TIGR02246 family)